MTPDAPFAMGGLTAPAIPGVMVTLADGRALVAWAAANANPTVDIEGPTRRLTSGWPDVVFELEQPRAGAQHGAQAGHRGPGGEHPLVGRQ